MKKGFKLHQKLDVKGRAGLREKLNYLSDLDEYMTSLNFKKYIQNFKGEDFAYWKSYDNYQIGLLIYDFSSKISDGTIFNMNAIGITFIVMPTNIDFRIDLIISKKTDLEQIEQMAETFYQSMNKYF